MQIKTVGVVGAGLMGADVAQALAQAGYSVLLVDVSQEILERARKEMAQSSRMQHLFKKKAGASAGEPLKHIEFVTDFGSLAQADYVIENVTEKWEVKQRAYRQLNEICPAHAVFAANTSAISITGLAAETTRPSQVIGLHFMNPVLIKPTVEMVRGYHTSEQTIEISRRLLASMGKEAILVNDSPGFVSNRVLMLTINEAIFLVQEQVAEAADIDRIFRECFGHKMGPLETADLIGLDTILLSIEVLYESFNDSKYRPCPLLKKMVAAGLKGRKSGQGFYAYRTE